MGFRDAAFGKLFSSLLVYNILYEDSEVDDRYLGLDQNSTVLGIPGAGCGMAAMLARHPARIDAVDINAHHLALTGLKVAAAQHLPHYPTFYDLFGRGSMPDPRGTVGEIAAHLPRWMQRYWWRKYTIFERSLYRAGLVARWLTRMRTQAGLNTAWLRWAIAQPLEARWRDVQARVGAAAADPLNRALMRSPLWMLTFGIDFAQRERLLRAEAVDPVTLVERYVRRLCETDVPNNWFAWYFAAGEFDHSSQTAVPPYLRREHHERSLGAPTVVRYHHADILTLLAAARPNTWTHYTLSDVPDWMPAATQRRLLEEILRTSKDGTVVLYRTVDDACMVDRAGLSRHFRRLDDKIVRATAEDRSRLFRWVNFYEVVH